MYNSVLFIQKNYIHLISQILLISFICKEFNKNWLRNSLLHTINHNCNKKSVHFVFKSTCLESCLLTFDIERILFWKHKKSTKCTSRSFKYVGLAPSTTSDFTFWPWKTTSRLLYWGTICVIAATVLRNPNILSYKYFVRILICSVFFFYSSESFADNRFFVEWNTSSLVLCIC